MVPQFWPVVYLPPINLKFTIFIYFEVLITNMMIKIPKNFIFKVKKKKKNLNKFFHLLSINIDLGKNISYESCSGWKYLSVMFYTFLPYNHYYSRKMRLNGIKKTGTRWGVFFNSNHPVLNGIKQTSTWWGAFLNENHPLLNGIKQTMYFLGPIK